MLSHRNAFSNSHFPFRDNLQVVESKCYPQSANEMDKSTINSAMRNKIENAHC